MDIKQLNIFLYEVECEKNVFDETADIALTISPVDMRKFNCFSVVKKRIYILVHQDHPLSQRSEVSLSDLDGEEIITMDLKHRSFLSFDQICREKGIHPHIVDMTNSCLLRKPSLIIFSIPILRLNKGNTQLCVAYYQCLVVCI